MKVLFSIQNHFGITPEFFFQGQRKYHSIIGIILSLLINLAAIGVMISLLIELFSKSNPIVNNTLITNDKAINITLNSDLIIAVGLLNKDYQIFNDPSIYQLKFYHEVRGIFNETLMTRSIPLKQINCTLMNLPKYKEEGLDHMFLSNQLHQYYCFNTSEEDGKVIIGGMFGSNFYGTIRVEIVKCFNSSDDIQCASEDEINTSLKDCWFEVFFIDHYVNVYNYSHPIQVYSNSLFTRIDPLFMKNLNAYFSKVDVFSNDNMIFDSNASYSSIQFEQVNNDIISINEERKLITLSIISSLKQKVDHRTYIKVPAIAGNVGGILNGLCIIGHLLIYYIERLSYKAILYDSLFDFSNEDNQRVIPLYKQRTSISKGFPEKKGMIINERGICNKENQGTTSSVGSALRLDLSLGNSMRMLCSCWDKKIRSKMIREFNRIEMTFGRMVDYVSLIKQVNLGSMKTKHNANNDFYSKERQEEKIKWIIPSMKMTSKRIKPIALGNINMCLDKHKTVHSGINMPVKSHNSSFGSRYEGKVCKYPIQQHNWSVKNVNSSGMAIL